MATTRAGVRAPRGKTCETCRQWFTVDYPLGRLPHNCPSCREQAARPPRPAAIERPPATQTCRLCGAVIPMQQRGYVICGPCRGSVQAARLCLQTLLQRDYIEVLAPGVYWFKPGAKEIANLLAGAIGCGDSEEDVLPRATA